MTYRFVLVGLALLALSACSGDGVSSVFDTSCTHDSDCTTGETCIAGTCSAADGDTEKSEDSDVHTSDVPDGDMPSADTDPAETERAESEPPLLDGDSGEGDSDSATTEVFDGDSDTDAVDTDVVDTDLDSESADADSLDSDARDSDSPTSDAPETDGPDSDAPTDCTSGDCCENGHFKAAGTVCHASANYEIRCEEENSCGKTLIYQYRDVTCSGTSAACDGPLVDNDDSGFYHQCQTNQVCTNAACVTAVSECCDCTSGDCCLDHCKIQPAGAFCNYTSVVHGCPYGNGPGSDVYEQWSYQTCTGDTTACTGPVVTTDWKYEQTCEGDDFCDRGHCLPQTCTCNADCPLPDYHCRQNVCVYSPDQCQYGGCNSTSAYCNTVYYACFLPGDPCQIADDCAGNPAGATCDGKISKCINPPHCNLAAANCYPGTECSDRDELLGYSGTYCINCSSDSDCYPGLTCKKRTLSPNICVQP